MFNLCHDKAESLRTKFVTNLNLEPEHMAHYPYRCFCAPANLVGLDQLETSLGTMLGTISTRPPGAGSTNPVLTPPRLSQSLTSSHIVVSRPRCDQYRMLTECSILHLASGHSEHAHMTVKSGQAACCCLEAAGRLSKLARQLTTPSPCRCLEIRSLRWE